MAYSSTVSKGAASSRSSASNCCIDCAPASARVSAEKGAACCPDPVSQAPACATVGFNFKESIIKCGDSCEKYFCNACTGKRQSCAMPETAKKRPESHFSDDISSVLKWVDLISSAVGFPGWVNRPRRAVVGHLVVLKLCAKL